MSNRTGTESPRRTLPALAAGVAAALAVTLAHTDARAQSPQPAPAPPPAAVPYPAAPPPGGYYAPAPGAYPYPPPGAYAVPGAYALQSPKSIDLEEGQAIPEGYHKATKPRLGLVIGGSVLFGVTWLTSVATGAIGAGFGWSQGDLLLIPVAGPFALLPGSTATGAFFLVLDGLSQAGGIAMLVAGLAAPKTVALRNDLSKLQLMPTPMTFGRNSGGFGFVGKF